MEPKPDTRVLEQALIEYIGTGSISNFDKICRTCLSTENTTFISDVTYENLNLWEVLKDCASVQMDPDDNLPKSICLSCITALVQVHTFKEQCQSSDDVLRAVISKRNIIQPIQAEEDVSNTTILETSKEVAPPKQIESSTKNENDEPEAKESQYTCKDCNETFTMYHKLKAHREKTHHKERNRINCPQCSKTIYRNYLTLHMRTHTKEKPFICEVCKSSFSLKVNLQRHILMHTGERPHTCDLCGKGFARVDSLVNHKRAHTGEKRFVCGQCGMRFSRSSSHKAHLQEHQNKDDSKNYECDICRKRFRFRGNLTQHKRIHTGEKPFLCSYCGKRFTNSSAYKKHLERHQTKNTDGSTNKYACDICKTRLMTKRGLQAHMLIHGEKNFLCTDCGRGFIRKSGLLTHMEKVHIAEKKAYPCTLCNKIFSLKRSLILHSLIHTRTKSFVCTICSKAYSEMHQLRYHMQTHGEEKPHVCTICKKAFALKMNLMTHMRVHTGEKPYICDVCDKEFYNSSSMTKHKRRHRVLKE